MAKDNKMDKKTYTTSILAGSSGACDFPGLDKPYKRQRHAAVAMGSVEESGLDMVISGGYGRRKTSDLQPKRRVASRTIIAATPANLRKFKRASKSMLVHKATKDLWQLSPDGKTIQALYTKEPIEE